jgi:transposase
MDKQAFLAIDVSKGYGDFLLLDDARKVLEEPFQLQDTSEGRRHLRQLVEKWFVQGVEQLYCGMESTGGYENNWYHFIKLLSGEFKIHVARLNARAVKAVSDAQLKRTITDAVSAENIAVYLMSFPEKVQYADAKLPVTDRGFIEGKQHHCYIKMLQKQKVQLVNQLEKLLYQYFSEILVYCRHGMPGWLLRLLIHYPCAEAMLKAGAGKLSRINGVTPAKADALMRKAKKSLQLAGSRIQHVIAMTSKEILHREALLKAEKNDLIAQYKDHPQVKLLATINGIALQSSIGLILEIEDVKRFAACKKMTANFGVHPTYKQSGDGVWGKHMSKKGPGEVRAILYMAALTGIRCNPILKALYARFRAKGMKHYQAMGVVMHKLLRIIYGVLKSNTPFDPEIDSANTARFKQKQDENQKQTREKENKIQTSKHRYQTEEDEAPISRVKAQKKVKQPASQTS